MKTIEFIKAVEAAESFEEKKKAVAANLAAIKNNFKKVDAQVSANIAEALNKYKGVK